MCVQYSIVERFKLRYLHNTTELQKSATFSMMIIRDPIDRLVSAYKNHVACDDVVQWKGPSDREAIVLHLLKLRDKDDKLNADVMQMEAKKRCLSFEEYVIVLADIHQMGKDSFINGHFRPQSCDCFIEQNQSEKSKYRVPEKLWTVVGTISNTSMFRQFYDHLIRNGLPRNSSQFFPLPKVRSIPGLIHPNKTKR